MNHTAQQLQQQIEKLKVEKQQLLQVKDRTHHEFNDLLKTVWWLLELMKNEREATERDIESVDKKLAFYDRMLNHIPEIEESTPPETQLMPLSFPGPDTVKQILARQVKVR